MRATWTVVSLVLFSVCAGSGTLVTVQSQTQEQMDALTSAVNKASDLPASNARVTLGTIEATMSRVVDADSEYLVAMAQSVPTLQLLSDIAFVSNTQTWHLEYQLMNRDDSVDLNQFKRTLYLTKKGNAHSGDHENPCLVEGVSDADCLQELEAGYTVPGPLSVSDDNLLFETDSITSTLTSSSHSLVQTLRVEISHTTVKTLLARTESRSSPTFGPQTQYTFGVGVVFLLAGRNTVLFDSFDLVENARAHAVISKTVSYSVAKHVSFFTEQVAADTNIRLVSIEYLIEAGHVLQRVSVSVNGNEVTDADCVQTRDRIAALADETCLQDRPICQVSAFTSDTGAGYSWVTYTLPIPAAVVDTVPELIVNTMLDTLDEHTGTQLWSSINFNTANLPRQVCTQTTVASFNPTQYAKAVLYQSLYLTPQTLSSLSHTVSNHTVNGELALTMADALMTLVLSPADGQSALEYFDRDPTEKLRLDEVYMSHAKPYAQLPAEVHNVLHGVALNAGTYSGRSRIVLDSALVEACPLESGDAFSYESNAFTCVTTQDWVVREEDPDNGALRRPHSAMETSFVYEVTGTDEDSAWLRSNIFGSSVAGETAIADFLLRVHGLTTGPRQAHSRTYWIWPLFAWPDEAPVGLKDKTVLSLAWSLSSSAQAPGRRLLGGAAVTLPVHVTGSRRRITLDMNRRHIDVRQLVPPYSKTARARPVHLQVKHPLPKSSHPIS